MSLNIPLIWWKVSLTVINSAAQLDWIGRAHMKQIMRNNPRIYRAEGVLSWQLWPWIIALNWGKR